MEAWTSGSIMLLAGYTGQTTENFSSRDLKQVVGPSYASVRCHTGSAGLAALSPRSEREKAP